MKHKGLFFAAGLYISFVLFWLFSGQSNPLLVAVLMVKNEEEVMESTLQPLVDAGIKDYFIYDTGSTDNTIVRTHQFFKKNNIKNYVIEQGEWIDFAASRNCALRLAEKHFPTAVFMLMLDAEWILHGGTDLLRYCAQHQHTQENLFFITLKTASLELPHPRLMRVNAGIEFVGRVHEMPKQRAQAGVPSVVYFDYLPTKGGFDKSKARWIRDADILYQDHLKNPDHPHTVFMLAQTYTDLRDYPSAIEWLKKRIAMNLPGHTDAQDEEKFLAYYFLGISYGNIKKYPEMLDAYQKAVELRPHRAEPLMQMALYYYNQKDYKKSFDLIKQSLKIPYPTNEYMYVFGSMYDYLQHSLASSMAYMFAEYELGLKATLQALETCKSKYDYEVLQKNLKSYQYFLNINT